MFFFLQNVFYGFKTLTCPSNDVHTFDWKYTKLLGLVSCTWTFQRWEYTILLYPTWLILTIHTSYTIYFRINQAWFTSWTDRLDRKGRKLTCSHNKSCTENIWKKTQQQQHCCDMMFGLYSLSLFLSRHLISQFNQILLRKRKHAIYKWKENKRG